MGAREMYDALNAKAPAKGKEKHHGNKRAQLRLMKIKARRSERAKLNKETNNEQIPNER